MELRLGRCPSPLGPLLLVTRAGRLCALEFADGEDRLQRLLRRYYPDPAIQDGPAPHATSHAVEAYFAGDLPALATIAADLPGTAFQRTVWTALRAIPPGTTSSYGAFARQLGRPGAARAVGHANGANPLGIVIPCHRLVGTGGALTGYGGGLPRKRWLLDHERRFAAAQLAACRT